MRIKGFGINADALKAGDGCETLAFDFDALARNLEHYAQLGFDCVEIPLHRMGAMACGKLLPPQVKKICGILNQFPFRYTVHAPDLLNLMDRENVSWQKKALEECIEFAKTIGATILVCHSGRYVPDEIIPLSENCKGKPDKKVMDKMLALERELLLEAAEKAEELGVTIALENAQPYLDRSPYCYAEIPSLLKEQVATVNHPNVKIALDIGHAYLASKFYKFNFLMEIACTVPFIGHVHLHDNFGRVSRTDEKDKADLMTAGRGDLHLPIGFGEIPAREVLVLLRDCPCVILHEIHSSPRDYIKEALELTKNILLSNASNAPERKRMVI
ncbi:MAG TPA: hypothetical protein DEA47_04305 [Peptococcaceae bacterium]|nr:MAG: Xylose isomerase domain-containing protein TIM barrel [Clostridia bacterium 41_269]HBT20570.1 hypothetical protein [Peptococcaceae bacterium]